MWQTERMLTVTNRLWMYCLAFAYIQEIMTIVVLDESSSGKPIWRESSRYRDRSEIPKPSETDKSKLSEIRQDFYPVQTTHRAKKWKIGRIFYTLPIGATFPVFYSSRNKSYKKGKKSKIYLPENWMWKQGRVAKATVSDHDTGFQNYLSAINVNPKK